MPTPIIRPSYSHQHLPLFSSSACFPPKAESWCVTDGQPWTAWLNTHHTPGRPPRLEACRGGVGKGGAKLTKALLVVRSKKEFKRERESKAERNTAWMRKMEHIKRSSAIMISDAFVASLSFLFPRTLPSRSDSDVFLCEKKLIRDKGCKDNGTTSTLVNAYS